MPAPTSDELIERDLPPAFPEWLKSRMPMLRAEATNTLYLAFRRRRRIYRPSMKARFQAWFDPRIIAVALAVPTVMILGLLAPTILGPALGPVVLGLVMLGFWPMAIGAVLLVAYLRNARRKAGQIAYLPPRVGEVFGNGGVLTQAALDVWMCSYTGRDVAEAIFLENYERSWRVLLGFVGGLFILPTVLTICFQFDKLDWFDWTVVLSVIGAVAASWWALLPQLFDMQGTRQLERRYAFWRSRSAVEGAISEFGRLFGENLPRAFGTGLAVAALGAAFIGLSAVVFGGHLPGASGETMAFIQTHDAALGLHFFLWWVILVFISIHMIWARHSVTRLEKAIWDAEYPFALLMASVVCDDPEGEAWARWRYGLRPLVRPVALRH